MTINYFEVGPKMSRAVVHNGVAYLAGITADRSIGKSVAEQAREILGKIDDRLASCGSDKSKILFAQIWLQDVRTAEEFNEVWNDWVVPGRPPARACVGSLMQSPAKMIEIQITAAV